MSAEEATASAAAAAPPADPASAITVTAVPGAPKDAIPRRESHKAKSIYERDLRQDYTSGGKLAKEKARELKLKESQPLLDVKSANARINNKVAFSKEWVESQDNIHGSLHTLDAGLGDKAAVYKMKTEKELAQTKAARALDVCAAGNEASAAMLGKLSEWFQGQLNDEELHVMLDEFDADEAATRDLLENAGAAIDGLMGSTARCRQQLTKVFADVSGKAKAASERLIAELSKEPTRDAAHENKMRKEFEAIATGLRAASNDAEARLREAQLEVEAQGKRFEESRKGLLQRLEDVTTQLTLQKIEAAKGGTKLRALEVRAREREEALHCEKMKALRDAEGSAAAFVEQLKRELDEAKAKIHNLQVAEKVKDEMITALHKEAAEGKGGLDPAAVRELQQERDDFRDRLFTAEDGLLSFKEQLLRATEAHQTAIAEVTLATTAERNKQIARAEGLESDVAQWKQTAEDMRVEMGKAQAASKALEDKCNVEKDKGKTLALESTMLKAKLEKAEQGIAERDAAAAAAAAAAAGQDGGAAAIAEVQRRLDEVVVQHEGEATEIRAQLSAAEAERDRSQQEVEALRAASAAHVCAGEPVAIGDGGAALAKMREALLAERTNGEGLLQQVQELTAEVADKEHLLDRLKGHIEFGGSQDEEKGLVDDINTQAATSKTADLVGLTGTSLGAAEKGDVIALVNAQSELEQLRKQLRERRQGNGEEMSVEEWDRIAAQVEEKADVIAGLQADIVKTAHGDDPALVEESTKHAQAQAEAVKAEVLLLRYEHAAQKETQQDAQRAVKAAQQAAQAAQQTQQAQQSEEIAQHDEAAAAEAAKAKKVAAEARAKLEENLGRIKTDLAASRKELLRQKLKRAMNAVKKPNSLKILEQEVAKVKCERDEYASIAKAARGDIRALNMATTVLRHLVERFRCNVQRGSGLTGIMTTTIDMHAKATQELAGVGVSLGDVDTETMRRLADLQAAFAEECMELEEASQMTAAKNKAGVGKDTEASQKKSKPGGKMSLFALQGSLLGQSKLMGRLENLLEKLREMVEIKADLAAQLGSDPDLTREYEDVKVKLFERDWKAKMREAGVELGTGGAGGAGGGKRGLLNIFGKM